MSPLIDSVQNEPQNEDDYALAAQLCRLSRTAAPHLRLAISEEPKPEIAERSDGACGYDIWIAHVRAYQQDYAWKRQRENHESVWIYSLDQDPDPYRNPTRVDRSGLHARIIPWVAWRIRASRFGYYDVDRFFPSGHPGLRAELLREGFEDYEYLWLANGRRSPAPGALEAVDPAVASVATGLSSFTKDTSALTKLRIELGRFIEGSRTTMPVAEAPSSERPRGSYYLNFQDPKGKPTADPLIVSGHTYQKIGWEAYDASKGYGWSGENIKNPAIARYGYDEAGSSEIERSYLAIASPSGLVVPDGPIPTIRTRWSSKAHASSTTNPPPKPPECSVEARTSTSSTARSSWSWASAPPAPATTPTRSCSSSTSSRLISC